MSIYLKTYLRPCAPNEDSDQGLHCPHEELLDPWQSKMPPVKILIGDRLHCQHEEMLHPWLFKMPPVKILIGDSLHCQHEEMLHPWLFKTPPVKILIGDRLHCPHEKNVASLAIQNAHSEESDQRLHCPHEKMLHHWLSKMPPVKILIRNSIARMKKCCIIGYLKCPQ